MTNDNAQPTWTDCPHCGARGSVEPFMAVPALTLNAGFSDERALYGGHERSMCYDCDAIVIRELTPEGVAQLNRAQ
jgi:hypothetical protein